jgi:microcystin-dependent protein
MSTLIVDSLQGLGDPTYTLLPNGICDPACLDFEQINGKLRLTIKKNSLDGSFFTGDFIPDGSITSNKIANGAVGTNQLADGAVTTAKIADHAVTQIKLAFGAVTNTEIASGTILSSNLAPSSVVTDALNNSAVTNPKLAAACVSSVNLAPASVANSNLTAACVSIDKLGPDVISLIQTAAALPPGTIIPSAVANPSSGFLFCDGSQVSRSVYAALYAAISTLYGPGDGSTTFNVPDLRGRSPIGAGAGPNLTNRALASRGGEETHTLVTAEMPYHTHTPTDNGHSHPVNEPYHSHSVSQTPHNHTLHDPGHVHNYIYGDISPNQGLTSAGPPPWYNNYVGQTVIAGTGIYLDPANANISIVQTKIGITIAGAYSSINIPAVGGSGPHNNMQPYIAINYFIKT